MLMDKYEERDQVRVLDFGIARLTEAGQDDPNEPSLTATGSLIGTPRYMSPEQAMGRPVDHRSDLYALGVLLYQMATGAVPFTAETPIRLLFMHAHDAPRPPSEIAPGRLPKRLEALILGLLAKSPEDRPQDAAAVVSALKRITEGDTLLESAMVEASVSRLSDPAAMARERAGREDPAGRVPTARAVVTVDPGADGGADASLLQTAAALETNPAAELAAIDITAPTMADDATLDDRVGDVAAAIDPASRPEGTEGEDTGALARAVLDTGAATEADAVAVSANPAAPVGSAVQGTPAAPAEGRGKAPWVVAALLLLLLAAIGTGAIGWLLVEGGETSSAAATDATPAVGEAAASRAIRPAGKPAEPGKEAAKPASVADAIAAAQAQALRAAVRAARAESGDPLTPPECEVGDPAVLRALAASTKLQAGGRVRGKRPQDERAVKVLTALSPSQAKSPEVQATLARAWLLAGASDPQVVRAAKAARGACPTLALAWEVEGTVHLLSMRPELAATYLAKAVALAPELQRARYNLGLAQASKGDAEAALASFEEVRRREPQRPGIMTGIGQAQLVAKRYDRAVAALEEAVKRAPKDAASWYLLGTAHQVGGSPGEALKAWCRAAKLGHPRAGRRCPDAAGIPVPK